MGDVPFMRKNIKRGPAPFRNEFFITINHTELVSGVGSKLILDPPEDRKTIHLGAEAADEWCIHI